MDLILAIVMLRQFENAVTQSADDFEVSILWVCQVIQPQQWSTTLSERSLQQLENLQKHQTMLN